MKVIASLRDKVGSEIPLRIVFEYPTPEGLASQIIHNTSWPYNPLLPLQTKGTKPPIFCVHPGGGFGTVYQNLSHALGPDQPVWAFQARGIGQEEALHESMDHMVEEYIAAMRSVQPSGPYTLLGWSSGGTVAHEMAVRLENEGDTVSAVILMDTSINIEADASTDDTQSHEDAVQGQLVDFAGMFDMEEDDISIHNDTFLQRLMHKMSAVKMLPSYTGVEDFRRVLTVYIHYLRIMELDTPGICNAPILLARASKDADAMDDAALAWGKYTKAGATSFDVDADHMGMWTEDVSTELADYIGPYLKKTICD
jgi:thioesterase domain-containing protein